MDSIRKIIKEEISRMLKEQDANPMDSSVLGGALGNIGTELATDLDNINKITKTHSVDLKNKENQIKANLQLKSRLDASSPQKKGLEVEIPQDQKDLEKRKKQLKDLEDAKKGLETAKAEIEKQQSDIENQTQNAGKTSTAQTITSVLPSLPSAI